MFHIAGSWWSKDTIEDLEWNQECPRLSSCISWEIVWGTCYLWGDQESWSQRGAKSCYKSHCKIVLLVICISSTFNLIPCHHTFLGCKASYKWRVGCVAYSTHGHQWSKLLGRRLFQGYPVLCSKQSFKVWFLFSSYIELKLYYAICLCSYFIVSGSVPLLTCWSNSRILSKVMKQWQQFFSMQ